MVREHQCTLVTLVLHPIWKLWDKRLAGNGGCYARFSARGAGREYGTHEANWKGAFLQSDELQRSRCSCSSRFSVLLMCNPFKQNGWPLAQDLSTQEPPEAVQCDPLLSGVATRMVRDHCFLRHIQWLPGVSGIISHEDQSGSDTCSQLLFSALTRSSKVWWQALRNVLKELAAIGRDQGTCIVKQIVRITFHPVLNLRQSQPMDLIDD